MVLCDSTCSIHVLIMSAGRGEGHGHHSCLHQAAESFCRHQQVSGLRGVEGNIIFSLFPPSSFSPTLCFLCRCRWFPHIHISHIITPRFYIRFYKHTLKITPVLATPSLLQRGWTTWTTGAVDKRVVAIVPMVMDLLNLVQVQTWINKNNIGI